MSKSTKEAIRQRVEKVLELRLAGAEFADIWQYASQPEQAWGISRRQLWRYIRKADDLCQRRMDLSIDRRLARHLAQRRQLYAHALELGDYRTALAVLRDEAELTALYESAKPKRPAPTDQGKNQAADGQDLFAEVERCAGILCELRERRLAGSAVHADGAAQPLASPPADAQAK